LWCILLTVAAVLFIFNYGVYAVPQHLLFVSGSRACYMGKVKVKVGFIRRNSAVSDLQK